MSADGCLRGPAMARRKWSRVRVCARRTLGVVVAGAALVAPAGRLIAQTPQDVQSLAEEAIRRLGLQTSFPVVPGPFRFSLKLPGVLVWVAVTMRLAVRLYAVAGLVPLGMRGADPAPGSAASRRRGQGGGWRGGGKSRHLGRALRRGGSTSSRAALGQSQPRHAGANPPTQPGRVLRAVLGFADKP